MVGGEKQGMGMKVRDIIHVGWIERSDKSAGLPICTAKLPVKASGTDAASENHHSAAVCIDGFCCALPILRCYAIAAGLANIADTLRLRAGQVHVRHGAKPQSVGTQTARGIGRSINS